MASTRDKTRLPSKNILTSTQHYSTGTAPTQLRRHTEALLRRGIPSVGKRGSAEHDCVAVAIWNRAAVCDVLEGWEQERRDSTIIDRSFKRTLLNICVRTHRRGEPDLASGDVGERYCLIDIFCCELLIHKLLMNSVAVGVLSIAS